MILSVLKIISSLEYLRDSEKKVANYIINNTEDAVNMPIGELAVKSDTSQGAVVRFCKALDYSGYREFSLNFASEMAVENLKKNEEYSDIQIGDPFSEIIKKVCYNTRETINFNENIIHVDDVEAAADAIIKAKRIDIYGQGASHIVALDMQQKFIRINKYATAFADPSEQITSAVNLVRGDVAIAISWKGNTPDTIKAARIAKQQGALLIGIGSYGNNVLQAESDIMFSLLSSETEIRAGAMSSRIAQLCLLDILYSCIISRDYDNLKISLDKSRTSINDNTNKTQLV